jgi:hypothetical protein
MWGFRGLGGPSLVPAATADEEAGLNRILRLRRLWWFVFLLGAPAAALLTGIIDLVAPSAAQPHVFVAAGYTWVISFCVVSVLILRSQCPRCGDHFHNRGRWPLLWGNPWTSRCLHCDLSLRQRSVRERQA